MYRWQRHMKAHMHTYAEVQWNSSKPDTADCD